MYSSKVYTCMRVFRQGEETREGERDRDKERERQTEREI